jgi:hypothetical protein
MLRGGHRTRGPVSNVRPCDYRFQTTTILFNRGYYNDVLPALNDLHLMER